jgi:hypothetical protein
MPNVVHETDPDAPDADDAPRVMVPRPMTAVAAAPDRIGLSAPRSKIGRMLGGAPRGCSVLVHGRAGAGKTCDAIGFASELAAAANARALLLSGEMAQWLAVEVTGRAGIDLSRVDILQVLGGPVPAFDPRPYVAVVYDSASKLGDPVRVAARAIEHARTHGVVSILIAQETTDHEVRGGASLAFDTDATIVILTRDRARIEKTRLDALAMEIGAPRPRRRGRLTLVR